MSGQLPGFDGVPVLSGRRLPTRIGTMLRMYGRSSGHTCGVCAHFRRYTEWHKCELYSLSASATSDWRPSWPACGQWEAELARDFVERVAEAELDALWHAFNRRTPGDAP